MAAAFTAICLFTGALNGTLYLRQERQSNILSITGTFQGSVLTPGLHGFHAHEKGDLGNGCLDAGPHFNPFNVTHGGPTDAIRHAGDWGNIDSPAGGEAVVNIQDNRVSLDPHNEVSILNRAIVVHQMPDDLGKGGNAESLKTGNSGSRLGCCKITATSSSGATNNIKLGADFKTMMLVAFITTIITFATKRPIFSF